jgi:uncharacterized protein (DUF885 family)
MSKCRKCEECLERQKKYYNENKEDIIRRSKEYYKNHKEELKEVRKEYIKEYFSSKKMEANNKIECECGGRYTKRNKSTHMQTKKHQDYVSNLEKQSSREV